MIDNHKLRIGALFLLTVISYGFYNAYLPVTDPVESNYVLSAITMLKHNSWISPMIYDQVWYDKPPLTYWALMITYKLFGVSDFTSRMPNTLIAGASVALMYHLVFRIKQSTHLAVTSAILLFSTLQFWYISHAIITDGFLFFFSLGIFGYSYLAFENRDRTSMVKAYVAAAFAVLTKGPVGIVLPGLILLLFICMRWFAHRENADHHLADDIQLLFNPLGLILFFIIGCPWYIAMYAIHGQDFITGFLGLHNIDRAIVSEHPKFNVWYYYIILIPLALLPWTPAIIYRLKSISWKDNFDILGILWFAVIVVFYSMVATKYITYTLLAIIPCIIWGTEAFITIINKNDKTFTYIISIPFFIYLGIFLTASYTTPELWPAPLMITSVIIPLLLTVSKHFIKNLWQQTIYLLTPIVILYSAVTVTVPPILLNQSGIQFKPYIESSNQKIYVYGTYFTSIRYYTEATPTQVFVHTTDNPLWTEGKTLMPTITKDEFYQTVPNEHDAIIIVPDKYNKKFIESSAYPMTKEIGKTATAKIYKVQ